MELIDLTGKKFGRLVVIYREGYRKKRIQWLCKCDCGNNIRVDGGHLRNGHTKSCGCIKWKGDKVQYRALHTRMYKEVKKPKKCTFCKKEKKLDLANISQTYKISKDDWMWLCHSCHGKYDNDWKWIKNNWHKVCSGCKKFLEVNRDNFYLYDKNKKNNNEWSTRCKECNRKKTRLYKKHHKNIHEPHSRMKDGVLKGGS